MKRFFRFIFSGRVWMNILLIAIFLFLVIQGVLLWLGWYTQHGDSISVPDLKGYKIDQLQPLLVNLDLEYEIVDSIYSDEVERGVVVSQNPQPERSVKQGRTIYLTVNSVLPEMVDMPELIGKSKRIALPVLDISGLKLESMVYRPDESCTDCVVDVKVKGESVRAGERIRKGEEVTLILGQQSNIPTTVPNLLGMTYTEAAELINSYSLNVGQIIVCSNCPTAEDTASAYVVNQRPERNSEVNLGTFIDLYLSTDSAMAKALQTPSDSLMP